MRSPGQVTLHRGALERRSHRPLPRQLRRRPQLRVHHRHRAWARQRARPQVGPLQERGEGLQRQHHRRWDTFINTRDRLRILKPYGK